MLPRMQSDEEATHSYPLSATRVASVSLVLALIVGALPLIKGGWFDIRWCAALSSAWLNVFTVALAAGLANTGGRRIHTESFQSRQPLGLRVWQAAWWRAAGAAAFAVLRTIRWQPWAVLVCAALSVAVASLAWRAPVQFALAAVLRPPSAALIAGVAAFALAFGTLVAELFFSMHAARGRAWASLANLLRAALLSALVAAVCAVLLAYAGVSSVWPVHALSAFSAAIALEFALRAVFSWFAPPHTRSGDASVPDSLVASLLRLRPSPLARFSAQLRNRYGIDLRQNWVLQSVVRLLPAAIGTIVVCAWLLTGVVILGPGTARRVPTIRCAGRGMATGPACGAALAVRQGARDRQWRGSSTGRLRLA